MSVEKVMILNLKVEKRENAISRETSIISRTES